MKIPSYMKSAALAALQAPFATGFDLKPTGVLVVATEGDVWRDHLVSYDELWLAEADPLTPAVMAVNEAVAAALAEHVSA